MQIIAFEMVEKTNVQLFKLSANGCAKWIGL